MGPRKLLSIIIPSYNEETNIEPFYRAIVPILDKLDVDSEMLFIDDGSTDRTFDLISGLSKTDSRVKCIRMSRNFGSHAGYMAGMRYAAGDASIIISCDLQDPPDLIPDFIQKWRAGHHVVWAVREGREDPFFKKLFAASFYSLFRKIALPAYPAAGMDFGLFDRKVMECLRDQRETNHFFTGMIVWLGFKVAYVSYRRRARVSGVSKWPLGKRLKNATDAILSFSSFPVRLILWAGLAALLAGLLCVIVVIPGAWYAGGGAMGWAAVTAALLFMGGVQLMTIGILGEYLWRVAEQTKGRPQYVVMDTLGLKEK